MTMIGELSDFITDELSGVCKYAKMAMHLKAENKELAEMFFNMANAELLHLKNIHSWLVKFIEKERKEKADKVPQGMLDVWEWRHKKMIKKLAKAEMLLQSYQKL